MKLKVLHVIEGIDKNLGGQPAAMFGILGIEKLISVTSEVLSIKPPNGTFNEEEYSQKFNCFEPSFPKRFSNSKSGINWLRNNITSYDFLIFHGIWTVLFYRAVSLAMVNNIPYVIWPHGSLVPYDLEKKALLKKILGKLFVKNALERSSMVCLTSAKEEVVFERYGSDPKTAVLPLPISIPKTNFYNKKNGDNFVFSFIGRINYKKGIDVFLKAFKQLSTQYPKIRFEIWGTGDLEYTKYINNLIIKEGLAESAKLMGFLERDKKIEVYQNSGCFVLTSMYENFGIAPIEALQGGVPILISENVFIWEDVQDAAWICKYSEQSVVENMIKILTNNDNYNYKKNIAVTTGNRYLPENIKPLYNNLYHSLIMKK